MTKPIAISNLYNEQIVPTVPRSCDSSPGPPPPQVLGPGQFQREEHRSRFLPGAHAPLQSREREFANSTTTGNRADPGARGSHSASRQKDGRERPDGSGVARPVSCSRTDSRPLLSPDRRSCAQWLPLLSFLSFRGRVYFRKRYSACAFFFYYF